MFFFSLPKQWFMCMALLIDSGVLTCRIQGLDCEGHFSIPTGPNQSLTCLDRDTLSRP